MGHRPLALGLLLTALACGQAEPEVPLDPAETARLDSALISLDQVTKRVRSEVLRTCDKWSRRDQPCVENAIRKDQLECWIEAGSVAWGAAQKRGHGPFSGDKKTMTHQNVCLQRRGWQELPGNEF